MNQGTQHPLITVIDNPSSIDCQYCSFSSIVIRKTYRCENKTFGRGCNDFRAATVSFYSPGKKINLDKCEMMIAFDSKFFDNVADEFPYFNFKENESLHISNKDKIQLLSTVNLIKNELRHNIDSSTRLLLKDYTRIILEYIRRFYKYQFILREKLNERIIKQLETVLNDYFFYEITISRKLPSDDYISDRIAISSSYLNEIMKVYTGKRIQEFARLALIAEAKKRVRETQLPISTIASQLGFSQPKAFSIIFHEITGYTPDEYRKNLNN